MSIEKPGGRQFSPNVQDSHVRVAARNNCARLRRILVRLHGSSSGAYQDMGGGCNAADGPKDKQDVQLCLAEALKSERASGSVNWLSTRSLLGRYFVISGLGHQDKGHAVVSGLIDTVDWNTDRRRQ
jgi:hypothetical protein